MQCPICQYEAYIGFTAIECSNSACEHYKPPEFEVTIHKPVEAPPLSATPGWNHWLSAAKGPFTLPGPVVLDAMPTPCCGKTPELQHSCGGGREDQLLECRAICRCDTCGRLVQRVSLRSQMPEIADIQSVVREIVADWNTCLPERVHETFGPERRVPEYLSVGKKIYYPDGSLGTITSVNATSATVIREMTWVEK